MSIATRVQRLYEAGDPGIDPDDDTPDAYDLEACFGSSEQWFVDDETYAFMSTGESLDNYRKRLKEGRVWRAS